ncbi:ABC transporter permease, partial [candidate division KSB1 bacterium]
MHSQKTKPPKLAEYLLKFLAPDNFYKSAPGDFEEVYNSIYREKGRLLAGLWYWWQVIKSFPSFIIDSFFRSNAMFKNYLKTTIRSIKRQKTYSIINISGLAIGMACCVFILMWVQDELSYDSFHRNSDELYRVTNSWGWVTPQPLAATLKKDYPEVVNSTRFIVRDGRLVGHEENTFYEDGVGFADHAFLEMFDFPFISGSTETAFNNLNSIVITATMAEKYFGNSDPLGEILTIDNNLDLEVTGVLDNIPENTNLQFEFLIPFEHIDNYDGLKVIDDWGYNSYQTYIQLLVNTNTEDFGNKLSDLYTKHFPFSRSTYVMQNIRDLRLYGIN